MPKPFPVPQEKAELCSAPVLPPQLDQQPQLCRALFDYTPELPDELLLRQGDIIQVLSKHTESEGWWDGQCRHRRGLFPNNFVELLPAPVPTLRPVMPSRDAESARSRFPLASRARCGARGAWHGTAQHGLVGSPTSAACKTAKDEVGEEGEHPDLSALVRMELAKLPPSKRMAPAPPVPAKAKPAPTLASKLGSPQPCASADMERGKASDPDADGFNVVPVTTAKLSHPTATRPRAPNPPQSTEGPVVPRPEERLALEDLKAEVRSLHILVDLMRVQHLRDLEDMRLEMCQERAKRQALQVEIERVRKALS